MRGFVRHSSQNFNTYSMIRSSGKRRISPALVGFWCGPVICRSDWDRCLESDRCVKMGEAIWIAEAMREITVQINDELFDFIDRRADGDRDRYLVKVLSHYRRWSLQQEMVQALQAEASDPEYQAEIALWDCTVGDGLDAAG
jgi:hypothetical protein